MNPKNNAIPGVLQRGTSVRVKVKGRREVVDNVGLVDTPQGQKVKGQLQGDLVVAEQCGGRVIFYM